MLATICAGPTLPLLWFVFSMRQPAFCARSRSRTHLIEVLQGAMAERDHLPRGCCRASETTTRWPLPLADLMNEPSYHVVMRYPERTEIGGDTYEMDHWLNSCGTVLERYDGTI